MFNGELFGEFTFAMNILVNVLLCVFLFFALNHTWKYEPDAAAIRTILVGWILLILAFGLPILI